ncbi:MBL fold metallo-hydrolase [Curtobacterium citreum]|uniref:MBL fold metallo-hydrolase n=1 Tax=Curtobacterium citreum TaxID=2036 RepID=UPI003D712A03
MLLVCQSSSVNRRHGESWLWDNGRGARVVVDVGDDADLASRAANFDPDILVLTHDDHDHIGAAKSFFEHRNAEVPPRADKIESTLRGRPRVRELWVPSDWLRLALAAHEVVFESTSGVVSTRGDHARAGHTLERPEGLREPQSTEGGAEFTEHRWYGAFELPERTQEAEELPNDIMEALGAITKEHQAELADAVAAGVCRERSAHWGTRYPRGAWSGSTREVSKRVAKTAVKVAYILRIAQLCGWRFRFFDSDFATWNHRKQISLPPWVTEGIPGVVTILNAVQVTSHRLQMKDAREALLTFAFLTVQNRRAIATFLWPQMPEQDDGVIIWSDTEARIGGQLPAAPLVPWHLVGSMSAPHHASVVAQHAEIWKNRLPSVRVINSSNTEDDAPEFLAIPPCLRSCTACLSLEGGDGLWSNGLFASRTCDPSHC